MQRSFVRVGHAMAIQFKKKYGVHDFCALVSTRYSYNFLKNQRDIAYTSLLLDEKLHESYKVEKLDIEYLKKMETEYGIPFLWPYLLVDRVLMHGQLLREYPYDQTQYSHEDLMKLLQVTIREVINFIEREKPDAIFFAVINNMSSYVLYEVAKKRGIRVIFGELSRFPDSYMITNDFKRYYWAEENWHKIQSGEIKLKETEVEEINSYITQFAETPRPYHQGDSPDRQPINRLRQFKFLHPKNWLKSLGGVAFMFKQYYSKNWKGYTSISPWNHLLDRMKRKIRMLVGFEDLYDEVAPGEDFVYFPLAVEPEIFLLLYAQHATNQLFYVRQLARSLPLNFKLYVKEHPAMVGYRTKTFYKELKKMPNVKLIRPNIKSFELIKNAKLIVTITGTAAWEALLYKKPPITFGNTFYNCLSMVKNCENIAQLPQTVEHQLKNFSYNHDELVQFIAALKRDTVPVDIVHLWYHERDFNKILTGIEPLVDLIAKRINLA